MDAMFDRLSAVDGRPSITPERLHRANLIQIPVSIRASADGADARQPTVPLLRRANDLEHPSQGLLADGITVLLTKLCAWFGVPRRTVYYKPTKAAPKVDRRFAEPKP
ncbi:Integrase, catalytic region [Cereibacter sphaeroides KD131]|nr:Integrase, catalytic region [Cereibacter sphaeroides KD131]